MTPTLAENPTLAKAIPFGLRPIRTSAMRSPHRPDRSLKMSAITRRKMLGLVPVALLSSALLPGRLRAETCDEVLPGLRLCDVWGWGRDTAADGVVTLTHATGITATIVLETGLDAEGETWANWQQSHAPISARANVLATDLVQIDGRFAARAAWRPRHVAAPTIVVMTGHVGSGLSLTVTTVALAETYTDTHREVHDDLCAAIRLDLPE